MGPVRPAAVYRRPPPGRRPRHDRRAVATATGRADVAMARDRGRSVAHGATTGPSAWPDPTDRRRSTRMAPPRTRAPPTTWIQVSASPSTTSASTDAATGSRSIRMEVLTPPTRRRPAVKSTMARAAPTMPATSSRSRRAGSRERAGQGCSSGPSTMRQHQVPGLCHDQHGQRGLARRQGEVAVACGEEVDHVEAGRREHEDDAQQVGRPVRLRASPGRGPRAPCRPAPGPAPRCGRHRGARARSPRRPRPRWPDTCRSRAWPARC